MMHAIRKLAREVHRRSVWQVVAAYGVIGWLLIQSVALATEHIGLPGWTPTLALILLALLLPVTIATAVVQGGLPWLRIEDVMDPNELEGLTPAQVHVIPDQHPLYGAAVLTWRNAVLLGVMSAAVLVTSVVAYLTMWALGIGPVGSLLAQGMIHASDVVIVADFENRTDDVTLGGLITDAFETDLSRSTLVSVLRRDQLPGALSRAGGEVGQPVTPTLVRQHAAEAGIAALVEGDVARFGTGYRVSVRIVMLPGAAPVSRFQQSFSDKEELLPAIDILSERVRAKFGESLRVIRSETPLADPNSTDGA